ncbi:MAG: mechanosensitive ion channel domain-containing protein [Bacteroidota bacterium]
MPAPSALADSVRTDSTGMGGMSSEALSDMVADAVSQAMGQAAGAEGHAEGWWYTVAMGLGDLTGLSPEAASGWMQSVLFLFVLWGLRQLVLLGVRRQIQDVRALYRWRKTSSYVSVIIGAIGLLGIWVGTGTIGSLATFLGLLTAGVAIALRDPLVNLAGWIFVLWRKPFAPGDRISIRGHMGDVIDQRLFQFTLLEVGTVTGAGQSTGRLIHIPNGWVFSDALVNHTGTFAYIWHEVAVVVTFESDWRAMKALLFEIADEHLDTMSDDAERTLRRAARSYLIFYSKLTPTVYTSVVGEGVQLTLRFLVNPRRVRGSEEAVWEAILDALATHDGIDLAYPTTRFYDNHREGKPGTSGPAGE